MRRDFHEHRDMFSRQNTGYDLDAQFLADLPDDRSYPLPQRAFQHLVAILRDPDDVVAMVKNRVTPARVAHTLTPSNGRSPRGAHFKESAYEQKTAKASSRLKTGV